MFKTTLYIFDKYTFPFFEKYTKLTFLFQCKTFLTIYMADRKTKS